MNDWKKNGINDGDIPCIMGLDPKRTLRDLWIEKKTGVSKNSNGYMKNKIADGKEKAAIIYDMMGEFEPTKVMCDDPDFKFCKAYIDGFNNNERKIICYRMSGKDNHELALKNDIVEPQYFARIQYQLWITGAHSCDYVSFYEGEIKVINVLPRHDTIHRIMQEVWAFYNELINDKMPAIDKKDALEIDDPDFINKITEYKKHIEIINKLKASIAEKMDISQSEISKLESEFKKMSNHPVMVYENFKIQTIDKKGTIDWKKAANMSESDAEKYRKKNSVSYKITLK